MPGLAALLVHVVGLSMLAASVLPRAVPDAAQKPSDATALSPCTLGFASGEPLRQVDQVRVVMRLESRCEKQLGRMRWYANGKEVQAVRAHANGSDSLFLLGLGQLEDERLTVEVRGGASGRGGPRAETATKVLRGPLVTLEIPGLGAIDFIPKNREARVNVLSEVGRLSLVPVAEAYKVRRDASGTYVQAEATASGSASLRFAYRIKTLPGSLAEVDLAMVTESIARPIRVVAIHLQGERHKRPTVQGR